MAVPPEAFEWGPPPPLTWATFKPRSEYFRRLRFLHAGIVEGMVCMLLAILEARGFTVPDDVESRITKSYDRHELQAWAARAVTAITLDDVFAGASEAPPDIPINAAI